jgi:hypothetical protein
MRQIIFRLLRFRNFVRGLDKRKAWEAGRTTFAIIGAAGYAGYLSAMHIVVTGTWYGVYRMMERKQ